MDPRAYARGADHPLAAAGGSDRDLAHLPTSASPQLPLAPGSPHNPAMAARGKVVVISGPSGTGKSSICQALLRRIPHSFWSVSVTTRPPRGTEVDGRDYRFVSEAEFERLRAAGALLEHAQYVGHWYGTPRAPVERAVAEGRVVIMEIDVQGGKQVARAIPDSIRIFVLPPTQASLQARLAGRRTESEALQRARLARADGEIGSARNGGSYPFFITNDILEDSVAEVLRIIQRECAGA
jgi:guanylate kinase